MNAICCGERMQSLDNQQSKIPYIKKLRNKYPGMTLHTVKRLADNHAPQRCVWQCLKCRKTRYQTLRRSKAVIAAEQQAISEVLTRITRGSFSGVFVDGLLVSAYRSHDEAWKVAHEQKGTVLPVTVLIDRSFR